MATANRIEIERAIAAMLPSKDEGTVSETLDDLKISVTYKLTRKVEASTLQAQWQTLPEVVQSAFKWAPEVSLTQLRALEKANPEGYAAALAFITSTPAKPGFKIEEK